MPDYDGPETGLPPPANMVTTVVTARRDEICIQQSKLVYAGAAGAILELPLGEEEVVVGTSSECALTLSDSTMSRRHFAVRQQGASYILEDLDSTNGTFVDDLRVREVYLSPGAIIRAGDFLIRFEAGYAPAEIEPTKNESFGRLLGCSVAMRKVFAGLAKVAPTAATVLIEGETGTGKGAVAHAMHEASRRKDGPFVVFDCAATTPSLVESELFGHERGAFTGAVAQRRGALEAARGGTLFIDELSELSLDLQPKLLRALEEREFSRVGGTAQLEVDCRIIAATQRDLWQEVAAERFRKDLYYRLAVVTIPLPRLSERREDLPMLIDRFLSELEPGSFQTFEEIDETFKQKLLAHDWPGNARELRNVIERASIMGVEEMPSLAGEPDKTGDEASAGGRAPPPAAYELPFKQAKEQLLSSFEVEYVRRLLRRANNNVTRAAREAGLGRKHLYSLLNKHGLGGGADGGQSDESG